MLTLSERREAWAQALESGDYKQGIPGLLKSEDSNGVGYCCLGVACEIFGKEVDLSQETILEEDGKRMVSFSSPNDISCTASLPSEVRAYLGLKTHMGTYRGGALYVDNDGEWNHDASKRGPRKSFAEIAQIIRSAPEGLFEDE